MELRKSYGISQRALAEKMTAAGCPTRHGTVAKIEGGEQPAKVDEVMALAVALEVSPLRLLLPPSRAVGDPGVRSGDARMDARQAWLWAEQDEPWWFDHPDVTAEGGHDRYRVWKMLRLSDRSADSDPESDPRAAEERERSERLWMDVDDAGGLGALLHEVKVLRRGDYGLVRRNMSQLRRELADLQKVTVTMRDGLERSGSIERDDEAEARALFRVRADQQRRRTERKIAADEGDDEQERETEQ